MKEVFSVYDVEKKAFSMLSGKYQICIGASVHDLQLKANIEVVGNSYLEMKENCFRIILESSHMEWKSVQNSFISY